MALSSGERRFFAWLLAGLVLAAIWCGVLELGTPTFFLYGSGDCRHLTSNANDQLQWARLLIGATYIGWIATGAWLAGWTRLRAWWQLALTVVWGFAGLVVLLSFDQTQGLAAVAFAAIVSAPVLIAALVARQAGSRREEPRYPILFAAIIAVGGPLALTFAEPFSRWHEISSCPIP